MKRRNYFDNFGKWKDVYECYDGKCPRREPKYVFAQYNREDYNGRSTVIISGTGRTFQVVEGSHCSCYGLEGQWEPTKHGVRELRKMMKAEYGFFHDHRRWLEQWLRRIQTERAKWNRQSTAT